MSTQMNEGALSGSMGVLRLPRPSKWLMACALVLALSGFTLLGFSIGGAGTNPLTEHGFVITQEEFEGKVEERVPAGSYTYFGLRLPDASRRWVVAMGARHRNAQKLAVTSYGHRSDYYSRRTGRTFDRLYFVSVNDGAP
jgi:hypothetical protein